MKIRQIEIEAYKFHSYPTIVWHSGKFWEAEQPIQEVYNNGSVAMVVNGIKRGKNKLIKELRKKSYKVKIIIDQCPF